jgi:glycosyltransferase involved in cell wall biosynthesis
VDPSPASPKVEGKLVPARRMKITFLTATRVFSGGDRHLVELVRRLDLSQVEPVILCSKADTYSAILNERYGLGVTVKTGFARTSFFPAWHALRREKPDVIAFVTGTLGAFPWYIFLAARLSGAKSVVPIYHNFTPVPSRPSRNGNALSYLARRAFGWRVRALLEARIVTNLATRNICVSENLRQRLVTSFGFPADKTVAIQNGVDPVFYGTPHPRAADVRRELGIRPDDILLVAACRLVPLKGLDILLQAVSLLQEEYPNLKCVIVGEGQSGPELRRASAEMGLSSRVFFVGFKEDVRPHLQAGDIFVNSSSASYVESFPFSILEAMASGLPCIGARAGGVPEIISDGEDGFLFAPGSVEELRTAIERLACDQTERKRMGELAREKVRRYFDLDQSMELIKSILLKEGSLPKSGAGVTADARG